MKCINQTVFSEFLLLGLTDDPELQPLIFNLFLFMYLVIILGNLLIILTVSSDSHLHTPMYFFLSNLSFTDICASTTTIPKMLANIQTQDQSVTYTGCLTQVGFVIIFAFFENCLLAVMAYNRYMAIGHPLRYMIIMNPRLCGLLALVSLLLSIVDALLHSLMLPQLSFCTDLRITHFFCELTQIIKLACSDTRIHTILMNVVSGIFGGVPLSGIIFSYICIVFSISRMQSSGIMQKAFSTCGSHLLVIFLFYGTGFGVYIGSTITDSPQKAAVASVLYTIALQMLNPFIYSYRNRDMKEALKKLRGRITSIV